MCTHMFGGRTFTVMIGLFISKAYHFHRRQDRRVLNALRRRRADHKLLICILSTSVTLLSLSGFGLYIWFCFHKTLPYLNPLKIVCPVVALCGLCLALTSFELCYRLKLERGRVKDPSLEKTKNLHEVKHWIEPGTSKTINF